MTDTDTTSTEPEGCVHTYVLGFVGEANGRWEQHLVCERCGHTSVGWTRS